MGYGTVGSGVIEVLQTNKERIDQRAGDEIHVKYILDLRDFPGDPIQEKIVHDFQVIAEDPSLCSHTDGGFLCPAVVCSQHWCSYAFDVVYNSSCFLCLCCNLWDSSWV